VECFRYGKKGHKCRKCPLRKEEERRQREERVVHVATPQKAQRIEWKRSSAHVLRQIVQEHCGVGISDEACHMKDVVVSYLVCEECGKQGCHVEENRGQRVISRRQLEKLKWCECLKKERKAVSCRTTVEAK